jgi:uncharacterized protein GlcG (DUF336 family)
MRDDASDAAATAGAVACERSRGDTDVTDLTLDLAERLLRSARAAARERDVAAISVVVLDADGNVRAAVREDAAAPAGVDIATAKARTVLAFGRSTREIAQFFGTNAAVAASLAATLPGRFVPIAGGVPLHGGGRRIGALAVAGGLPDVDDAIAQAAAAATG